MRIVMTLPTHTSVNAAADGMGMVSLDRVTTDARDVEYQHGEL